MPDIPAGLGSGSGPDRLNALRQNTQSQLSITSSRKIRIEMLLGVGAFLVLIAVLFVLVGVDSNGVAPSTSIVAQSEQKNSELQSGEALIAIALDEGTFPPEVEKGDQVRVVVTPNSDGTGTTRALNERTFVESLSGASDVGGRHVMTIRGPESVAIAVAASGAIHIAVIREAQ
jgi:hypothetical protein